MANKEMKPKDYKETGDTMGVKVCPICFVGKEIECNCEQFEQESKICPECGGDGFYTNSIGVVIDCIYCGKVERE